MKGFKLIALSEKGVEAIKKQGEPDKRMEVKVISELPYIISFTFKESMFKNKKQKDRFMSRSSLILGLIYASIKKAMKKKYGCELEIDYTLKEIK